jgi:hypothetical protein
MMEKAAKVQQRSDMLMDKQKQLYDKQIADQKVHATANKTMTDNITIDPNTNRPIISPKFFKDSLDIARNNPDAPSAALTARTLLDWGEHQQAMKASVVSDPATTSDLNGRMFDSSRPTSELDVMRAETDGKLSHTDAQTQLGIISRRDRMPTDPQFKLAMDGAKELIEGRTAGEKSLQVGKYASFMQDFLQQYQQQKLAGTLPPDALSLRNPNSLISKAMEAYKSPLAAAIGGNGGVAVTPAKRDDVMPAIPPPDQRPPGLYNTPKGNLRWTGTGWIKP